LLEGLLRSEDERIRIQAAKGLYSYSATPALSPGDAEPAEPVFMADGRRATGIRDVLALADELDVDVGQHELADENARLRAEVKQLRAQLAR
jgi:hypothetical protein